jgi:hypothetical protein
MATDIVQSLFGVTPDMYQQQQARQADARALQFAQLTPMQQAQYGIGRGAYGLAGAIGGALGAQDPELQRISARNASPSRSTTTILSRSCRVSRRSRRPVTQSARCSWLPSLAIWSTSKRRLLKVWRLGRRRLHRLQKLHAMKIPLLLVMRWSTAELANQYTALQMAKQSLLLLVMR